MAFNISKLCPPAYLYVWFSIVSIIIAFAYGIQLMFILVKIFFMIIWTWVLNYLCANGLSGLSWALVLFPFLVIFFSVISNSPMMYVSSTIITPIATMR